MLFVVLVFIGTPICYFGAQRVQEIGRKNWEEYRSAHFPAYCEWYCAELERKNPQQSVAPEPATHNTAGTAALQKYLDDLDQQDMAERARARGGRTYHPPKDDLTAEAKETDIAEQTSVAV